jgi:hypothetical protein
MKSHLSKALLALCLAVGGLCNGRAQAKVVDAGPQSLSQISNIGESLQNAGPRTLHILYVHGIGATGAGDSQMLLKGICASVKGCNIPAVPVPVSRDYADKGRFANGSGPPAFEYMGKRVWTSKDEWSASAPFVDHYVLRRSDGGPVVVDEINWWPLVFPLKCRNIMPGEALLAGPDAALLNLCSMPEEKDLSHPGRFKQYTWLGSDQATMLKSIRSKGALINRDVKSRVLDWGFSDAIMAVGSMHDLLTEGMRQLFVESVRFNADDSKTDDWEQQQSNSASVNSEFIVVSHSLGSYLVFATLNLGTDDSVPNNTLTPSNSDAAKEDSAARYILERTSLVYFFANQLALLELANVAEPSAAGLTQSQETAKTRALSSRMIAWKNLRLDYEQRHSGTDKPAAKPPQVIAWSDPSDLLSWYVPAMDGLVIANLYLRNTWWHWLFANPEEAHDNYASNKQVLRVILGPK